MMILRKRSPELPRVFRCPAPMVVGTIAIVGCVFLLFQGLPTATLWRFLVWNVIGLGVYLVYGRARSLLRPKSP
jgi:APA family basic amino acid/polyamine antiporter